MYITDELPKQKVEPRGGKADGNICCMHTYVHVKLSIGSYSTTLICSYDITEMCVLFIFYSNMHISMHLTRSQALANAAMPYFSYGGLYMFSAHSVQCMYISY